MLFSIVTINFNNAAGLEKTIRSVISQTCHDFEYIIVDGGSTDGSVDVIKRYSEKIDCWVSERDKGIYNAMNKGVRMAHGEYIAFLNSGDIYYDNKVLERTKQQEPNSDICIGDLIDTNGRIQEAPEANIITMSWLLRGGIAHPASFTRRKLLLEEPFDERMKIDGDYIFFIRAFVVHNASYKKLKGIIAIFDTTGISSRKHPIEEKRLAWQEIDKILPPRVRADYDLFMGKKDNYHRLFFELSFSKHRKWIYRLVVVFLKLISLNHGFIRNYKL